MKTRFLLSLSFLAVVLGLCVLDGARSSAVDDEFDEFEEDELEEFDFGIPEEDFDVLSEEEEEDEFLETEEDEEEDEQVDEDFTGFDSEEFEGASKPASDLKEDLKIAESTVRMKPFWEAYLLEIFVASGIIVYVLNYLIGRTRNYSLAQSWLTENANILRSNFHVSLTFKLSEHDMDSFVLALGQRRVVQKMYKEYEDLANYCQMMRPGSKLGLDSSFFVISEISEATSALLSQSTASFLSKNAPSIQSLHISDQYTGIVQDSTDSETVVLRKPERRIAFTFNVSGSMSETKQFLQFALALLDQIKSLQLSREGREKALKNRAKVAQSLDKLQHSQRQEAAQQRREDRKRAEKEKMMNETDPQKTRKWEEKEAKKSKKKMTPKMKQMKVLKG